MATVVADDVLVAAGLPEADITHWTAAQPTFPPRGESSLGSMRVDAPAASTFFMLGEALLRRLPARPSRSDREQAAALELTSALRDARLQFLRRYSGLL